MKRTDILTVVAVVGLAWVLPETGRTEGTIDGRPISRWVAQLRSENRGLQLRASRALSEAPEKTRAAIVPKVMPLLKSERENDKFVAAQVLGEYGQVAKAAVPDLLPMLKGTQHERNRAAAAKALGQILEDAEPSQEIDEVTKALIPCFTDKYSDVRREAVRACGMIGPAAKAFLPHVVPLLREHKPGVSKYAGYHVRLAAAWAVGRMGPHAKMHIDSLISLLHVDGQVNPHVAEAIGEIGAVHENVVPNIVDHIEQLGRDWRHSPHSKMNAWIALERFGPQAAPAAPLIARYLREGRARDEPAELFIQWFKILRAMGPAAAREALPAVKRYVDAKPIRGWENRMETLRKEAAETVAFLEGKE